MTDLRDQLRRNLEAMARELARNPGADQRLWERDVVELRRVVDRETTEPSATVTPMSRDSFIDWQVTRNRDFRVIEETSQICESLKNHDTDVMAGGCSNGARSRIAAN